MPGKTIHTYKHNQAGCQWLTSVILATQEAEIRKTAVRSQPGETVCDPISKNPITKNWAGGMAQGEGLEFKVQKHKKKKNNQKPHNQVWGGKW
jgi:hypothetical protein